MDSKPAKLAVLIDADNFSIHSIESILKEIAKYGIASVKRVYGDWSSDTLKKWRDILLPHAITPIQQFAYTKGKDATDMMLIIDAMDLLHSGVLDGFCIISSDSDFTPLASRIRENGLIVYGFGKTKTPEAFRQACDQFICVESLMTDEKDQIKPESLKKQKNEPKQVTSTNQDIKKQSAEKMDKTTLNLIYKAVKNNLESNGWANFSKVSQHIRISKPDFNCRDYGRSTLSGLIKSLNLFEIKIEEGRMYIKKIK